MMEDPMKWRIYAAAGLVIAAVFVSATTSINVVYIWGAAYLGLAVLLSTSSLVGRKRVFLHWALVLSTIWTLLNMVKGSRSSRAFQEAGIPWSFAKWQGSELMEFEPSILAVDIVVSCAVVALLAGLCTRSRRSEVASRPYHNDGAAL
jgi:hypothetical protein